MLVPLVLVLLVLVLLVLQPDGRGLSGHALGHQLSPSSSHPASSSPSSTAAGPRAMDHAAGAAAWERQHSERVARTTQRRFALAEGVRRVFVQRLGVLSLDEAFSAMDLNKDGVLSVGEFKKGLRALNIGLMPWEVSEFVSVIDSDMSGTIDRQEFVEMFGHSVSLPPTAAASAATTGGQPDAGAPTALPGAKRGSSGGGVFDSELSGRLDELEAQSAGVIDPDAYGFYTRADAMEDESRLLVRPPRVCHQRALPCHELCAAFIPY